jgi:hypothetical protein
MHLHYLLCIHTRCLLMSIHIVVICWLGVQDMARESTGNYVQAS